MVSGGSPAAVLPGDRPRGHEHQGRRGRRRRPARLARSASRPRPTSGPRSGSTSLAEAGRRAVEASGVDWSEIAAVGLGSAGDAGHGRGRIVDAAQPAGLERLPDPPEARRAARAADGPAERRQRRGLRRILGGRRAKYREPGAVHARHRDRLRDRRDGPDRRGPAQPRRRVRPHHRSRWTAGGSARAAGRGHLEAYASATSLVKRAVEALEREPRLGARRRSMAAGALTARAIADAAAAGDPLASRLIRETARYLAVGAVDADAHDRPRPRPLRRRDDRRRARASWRRSAPRSSEHVLPGSRRRDPGRFRRARRRCRASSARPAGRGSGSLGIDWGSRRGPIMVS